jgi:hypothetical protein
MQANDADALEQAQPPGAEPASESPRRAGTASPEALPQDDLGGSVADQVEHRQEP